MNKNIILMGVVAIGIYLLSQAKKIPFITGAQKTVRRSPPDTTQTVRRRTAQKISQRIAQKVAQKLTPKKIGQPTTQAARILAAQKAAAARAWIEHARKIKAQKAAAARAWIEHARKIKAQKAAAARAWIEHARKIKAQKVVTPWKAPYRFPKPKFRVITPSDILRNISKEDIFRKKALQQKMTQKTTHNTPSDRRKKRLEALYGSHWQDVWSQRQK